MIAAQTGTDWRKIVLKKWYTSYKDHIKLSDYEIHNGMSLELYYVCCLLAAWLTGVELRDGWRGGSCMHFNRSLGFGWGVGGRTLYWYHEFKMSQQYRIPSYTWNPGRFGNAEATYPRLHHIIPTAMLLLNLFPSMTATSSYIVGDEVEND